jgi:hypothetical protein
MVGLTVDTGRLYDGEDPGYEIFLRATTERIYETYENEARDRK